MIADVERERRRMSATEASPELVEPFKRVVQTAMIRVREGDVDTLNRQRVTLRDDVSKRVYLVTDVEVSRTWALGRTFVSQRDLKYGLFVEGIQLDDTGEPISRLTGIQIPRDHKLVNQDTLYLQRGSDPEAVLVLARELENSQRFPQRKYNQLVETLRGRELAS